MSAMQYEKEASSPDQREAPDRSLMGAPQSSLNSLFSPLGRVVPLYQMQDPVWHCPECIMSECHCRRAWL